MPPTTRKSTRFLFFTHKVDSKAAAFILQTQTAGSDAGTAGTNLECAIAGMSLSVDIFVYPALMADWVKSTSDSEKRPLKRAPRHRVPHGKRYRVSFRA